MHFNFSNSFFKNSFFFFVQKSPNVQGKYLIEDEYGVAVEETVICFLFFQKF